MARKNGAGGRGLRDRILAAEDLPRIKVAVEEWGCDVWLRALSSADSLSFTLDSMAKEGDPCLPGARVRADFQLLLLVRSIVDEDGNRVFANDEAQLLAGKSETVLAKLYQAAAALSGIRQIELPAPPGEAAPADPNAPDPTPADPTPPAGATAGTSNGSGGSA